MPCPRRGGGRWRLAGRLTPIRVFPSRDGVEISEIDIEGVGDGLPFQIDQIEAARALGRPIVTSRVGAADLGEGQAPSGVVLHGGRCGSTFVAQALAGLGMCRLASEPLAINDLLGDTGFWRTLPWARRERGLVHAVDRLRRASGPDPLPFVLKLSSWNAIEAGRFERLWSGAPKLYLYRDPAAALASLVAAPPGWARHADRAGEGGVAGFLARTMAGGMSAVADLLETDPAARWLLVHHAELPGAITDRIAPHFGLEAPRDADGRIAALARIDAKDPSGTKPFVPARPEPTATPEIADLVGALLSGPYGRLEALRLARAGS